MDPQGAHLPPGTETERWVRMERRLYAPPERVFRAWTDPEELARWLPERVEGGLAEGAETTLVWHRARVSWDILQVDPSETFRFRRSWPPDGSMLTTVTVTVRPSGYGSRVSVEEGPFALDEAGGLDAWAESIETWAAALVMLRANIDMSVDVRDRR